MTLSKMFWEQLTLTLTGMEPLILVTTLLLPLLVTCLFKDKVFLQVNIFNLLMEHTN